MKLAMILSRLSACPEARTWAKNYPDLQAAWTNCQRSDWMLWLIARTVLDQNDPRLRLLACDFAEAVWAAWDAACAAWAACAARDAACVAGAASVAGDAGAAWAAACAAWAARDAQSDIIRRYFPECPEIKPELLRSVPPLHCK
jgi:hypothetical protein